MCAARTERESVALWPYKGKETGEPALLRKFLIGDSGQF